MKNNKILTGSICFSSIERKQNPSKEQLISLLEEKLKNSTISLNEALSNDKRKKELDKVNFFIKELTNQNGICVVVRLHFK
jgi:agmatine/peptidylarginine deiminase